MTRLSEVTNDATTIIHVVCVTNNQGETTIIAKKRPPRVRWHNSIVPLNAGWLGRYFVINRGRMNSLSSWSRMWQCST